MYISFGCTEGEEVLRFASSSTVVCDEDVKLMSISGKAVFPGGGVFILGMLRH